MQGAITDEARHVIVVSVDDMSLDEVMEHVGGRRIYELYVEMEDVLGIDVDAWDLIDDSDRRGYIFAAEVLAAEANSGRSRQV